MALVLLSNLAFAVLGVGLQGVSAQTLSSLVLINLSLAILIRQQYLINALFWLAIGMLGIAMICLLFIKDI